MRKELSRIEGIEVLSCNGNKATIEVMKMEKLQLLQRKGYKVHKEECNIYLAIKP